MTLKGITLLASLVVILALIQLVYSARSSLNTPNQMLADILTQGSLDVEEDTLEGKDDVDDMAMLINLLSSLHASTTEDPVLGIVKKISASNKRMQNLQKLESMVVALAADDDNDFESGSTLFEHTVDTVSGQSILGDPTDFEIDGDSSLDFRPSATVMRNYEE